MPDFFSWVFINENGSKFTEAVNNPIIASISM